MKWLNRQNCIKIEIYLRRDPIEKGVSICICYSIFQKCITSEALYYGQLIYNDGTRKSLREIMNTSDENLFDYISDWYHRIWLDYIIAKLILIVNILTMLI